MAICVVGTPAGNKDKNRLGGNVPDPWIDSVSRTGWFSVGIRPFHVPDILWIALKVSPMFRRKHMKRASRTQSLAKMKLRRFQVTNSRLFMTPAPLRVVG